MSPKSPPTAWLVRPLRPGRKTRPGAAGRARPLGTEALEAREVPAAGGGWTDAGLTGTYYADASFTTAAFTRKDQRIDFDWGTVGRPGGSISPGFRDVGADNYSVRWAGRLVPRYTETYTFGGVADDAFVLELKKPTDAGWTTVVNQAGPAAGFSGTYALQAGQVYDVRVSYRELTGAAVARLRWSSPSTPLEVIDTLTQSGINNPDGTAAFVDLVKGARNGWEGVDGKPRPAQDADGWPTGDAGYYFQESLNQGLGLDPLMRGRVTFRFTGKADMWVQGSVDRASLSYQYDTVTNTTTGSFLTRDNNVNASFLGFRNTTRTGQPGGPGGITDLRLLRPAAPDAAATYPAGTVFTDQIKAAMGRVNVIRFQYVANQQKEWADRTPAGYFNQSGGTRTAPTYPLSWDTTSNNGWSWEYKVMLANETGRDLMLSLPVLATGRTAADSQSYLAKLANLLKYGSDGVSPYTSPQANPVYPPLNPNLRVYLELGNELWNYAAAYKPDWNNLNQLTGEAVRSGGEDYRAINYDGLPTTTDATGWYTGMNTWRHRMAALRMVQVSNIFRAVYGDGAMPGTSPDPVVRPVYEWQYDNANGTASTPLTFLDAYFNNGDGKPYVATPRPVNYYLWGGGGAAYYGANNGNGLTDLLPDPGFDAAAVPTGYAAAPAGTGWSFAGTAGVARDGGAGDDIPPAFTGGQVGYVAGTGRLTATFTVPSAQTSDVYAVAFKAVNRKKVGAAAADTQNLRVYLDYGTPNQVDITAKTFSQGNGYTPPSIDGIGGPWNARNVFWVESQYYYSKTVRLAAGSTHTVTIVGTRAEDQLAFLDDVRVTSVDAIFAGGIPAGGEAAGQPAGQRIRQAMNTSADWASAYGLRHVAYESGWSLGGDDGGSPVQLAAKYGDARTADAQGRFMDFYHEAGGEVNVFGTYAQWPRWSDFYAAEGLVDVGRYPIVGGITAQANRLPNLPTNGTAVAPTGVTAVPPAASLSGATAGPRVAVGGRTTSGYAFVVDAPGWYTLTAPLANATAGGQVRVLVDGRPVGVLQVPNTGSVTTFADAAPLVVALTPGRHVVLLTPLANSGAGYAAVLGDLRVATPTPGLAPPAAPSGLSAAAPSDRRVDLRWADNAGTEAGFVLERATARDFVGAIRLALGPNVTAYADTGVSPGATYFYRVRAANGGGESAVSAAVSVTTPAGAPVLRYEFTGLLGNEASAPVTGVDPRVAVSAVTRGPGLRPTTYTWLAGVQNTFGSLADGSVYGATLADAIARGQYYQFTVTPAAGRALSVSSLTFLPYFQNAGGVNDPRGAGITYSTNGLTFSPGLRAEGTAAGTGTPFAAHLAREAALQNVAAPVTFRVYLFGNGNYEFTGIGGAGDDIRLAGRVTDLAGAAARLGGAGPLLVGGADVGAPPVAGETEYAPATGVVTVRGGGAGIAGRADQFHLASVPAAGDQALVARVTAVGNTSRGAQAGVMFRDGATATARFAAAVVTPGNGVRFLWRSAAGGPVAETGVDGVAAPVWLKLVRAGDTYSAYYAATAGTPGAADWVAVGSPRAMTFAAATYRAGLAVSSLDRANRLTATFTDVSLTAGAGVRLAGTVIGTAGSRDGAGRTRDKAFDGNLATYFDAPAAAGGWVGLDLGAARAISQIRFAPRAYASVRMVGGVFQASNTADFSSGVVTLHTVGAAPVEGARTAVAVAPAGQYRYVRYLAPALSWGNIAEFEVYGPAT